MSEYVADTHTLIWHLTDDARLSEAARRICAEADAGLHRIFVPGIVLIEMVYLAERGRIAFELVERVTQMLDTLHGSYAVAPLDQRTARALRAIPRASVPEMPDRIVAASAHQLGLPLLTADRAITNASVVPVIW